MRPVTVQAGPFGVSERQISAVGARCLFLEDGGARRRPSVLRSGVVHSSRTVVPWRWAVRSAAGLGRFNDGALGGPGLAQPVRTRPTVKKTTPAGRYLRVLTIR